MPARSLLLALASLALAACERGGEAPPSGGFENEQVVTPAEVPADVGEPGARTDSDDGFDATLGDPAPLDTAGVR